MKFRVMGVQRHVNWSYNGSTGVNQRLHLVRLDELINQKPDDDNEGRFCEVVKVPLRVDLHDVHAGDNIEIFYNRFGQVEYIQKVK